MRLDSSYKIGQSGYELVLSVFLSFFLHAAILVLALILYTSVRPKTYMPLFYNVKLVGRPAEIAPAPAAAQPATLPKAEPAPPAAKPEPKIKVAASKPERTTLHKDAIPELSPQKKKPAKGETAKAVKTEPARPVTANREKPGPKETAAAPNTSSGGAAPAVGRTGPIVVNPAPGDSGPLSYYTAIMRDCIERNWNPPPGGKGMEARVLFKVLRTGRVFGDVNIEVSSGNAYFDMAAKRAILSSSPFPSLPEEFYKQYAEFVVVLQERD